MLKWLSCINSLWPFSDFPRMSPPNQIIETRLIGFPLPLSCFCQTGPVQAKGHGQHRDSKTLRSASRQRKPHERHPWGSRVESCDHVSLPAGLQNHSPSRAALVSRAGEPGVHESSLWSPPSKASSGRCLPPVVSSSYDIPFLRTSASRGRGKSPGFSHKQ